MKMKFLYRIFTMLIALTLGFLTQAQEILRVEGVLTVGKGETYRINPGTQVVFSKGARIWIEGAFIAEGTSDKPIQFRSENSNDPGIGLVINGIDFNASVRISNAHFLGMGRPLSFEPFWSRKEVVMDHIRISQSSLNESVLYVATAMTNQNLEPIQFSLTNSEFFNNRSGVNIENVGAPGIRYKLDNLSFDENQVEGSDASLGILNLNIATPFQESNIELGNLAFNRNFAGEKSIGLSLAGNAGKLKAGAIYSAASARPVYDYLNDPRLPELTSPKKNLGDWSGQNCFIENVIHQKGLVVLKSNKLCSVQTLLDSSENSLSFTQSFSNDSLLVSYAGRYPRMLITKEGKRISIPAYKEIEKKPTEMKDTAGLGGLLVKPEPKKYEEADTTQYGPRALKPFFEVGAWGGLATYIGDLRHKFGIPGIFEWTGGLYLQYNVNRNKSYRLTFYRTNIGMHDPTAPLYIWQGAPLYVTETSQGPILQRLSFDANFKTKMYIIDLDAHFYLFPDHDYYAVKNGQTKWIYALGYGAGLMYFEPYRCIIYPSPGQEAVYVPSRQLGMEGQNYLKAKSKYWPVALNFNVSTQVVYAVTKRIRFKYEFKAVLSMSDYIDDYGQGFTYGGDYLKWRNSLGDIDLPVNKRTGQKYTIDDLFPSYNTTIKRTFNLLPDMFFQQHIGISYDIGDVYTRYWKNRKKKKVE